MSFMKSFFARGTDKLVVRAFVIAGVAIIVLETGLMYEGAKDASWANLSIAGVAFLIAGAVHLYSRRHSK